ncbi:MAG: hypothetical protein AAFY24_13880, partial [Pseudomonadota bacterium]
SCALCRICEGREKIGLPLTRKREPTTRPIATASDWFSQFVMKCGKAPQMMGQMMVWKLGTPISLYFLVI